MINEQELQDLEKIAEKQPLVKKLLDDYNEFYKSPYFDTYITLYTQVSDWNAQLKIGEEKTTIGENGIQVKTQSGKIDLFADKDSKEFERVFKYFSEVLTILDALDKIREKLSPKEKVDAEKAKKLSKSNAVAI